MEDKAPDIKPNQVKGEDTCSSDFDLCSVAINEICSFYGLDKRLINELDGVAFNQPSKEVYESIFKEILNW